MIDLGDHEMKQRSDDPPMKITREIPLPWLIGIAAGIIAQAVMIWVGQQQQGQAIRDMTVELKELRAAAVSGGLQAVKMEVKLDDHERRIQILETRK